MALYAITETIPGSHLFMGDPEFNVRQTLFSGLDIILLPKGTACY